MQVVDDEAVTQRASAARVTGKDLPSAGKGIARMKVTSVSRRQCRGS
jgi:hypothetical protein